MIILLVLPVYNSPMKHLVLKMISIFFKSVSKLEQMNKGATHNADL
jgi:hypothetical protein